MNSSMDLETDRAKRLMAMGQMAASLAHEIRNPLGSMELFCSLLKKDLVSQPESFKLAEQIHVSIKTLDRVIRNCLQFSREIIPHTKEVKDIDGYLASVITSLIPRAKEDGVILRYETHGEASARLDSHLMTQVLCNLILNSIDSVNERMSTSELSESQFKPEVIVRSTCDSSDIWRLSIEDNGIGVPETERERVFDPFFTTKPTGTGLGLAIVHSIVSAHGGTISIENQAPSTGTTFIILLPRTIEHRKGPNNA